MAREIIATMGEPLWRMTREKTFELVKKTITRARIQERDQIRAVEAVKRSGVFDTSCITRGGKT